MKFIKTLLTPQTPVQPQHPLRADAVYTEDEFGAQWEIETTVAGTPFCLAIDVAERQEPTAAQFRFFERYAENPSEAFAKARVLLVPGFERHLRKKFPDQWRQALNFVGMSVPVSADENRHWEVHFECTVSPEPVLFTCSFENDAPIELEIDA